MSVKASKGMSMGYCQYCGILKEAKNLIWVKTCGGFACAECLETPAEKEQVSG